MIYSNSLEITVCIKRFLLEFPYFYTYLWISFSFRCWKQSLSQFIEWAFWWSWKNCLWSFANMPDFFKTPYYSLQKLILISWLKLFLYRFHLSKISMFWIQIIFGEFWKLHQDGRSDPLCVSSVYQRTYLCPNLRLDQWPLF